MLKKHLVTVICAAFGYWLFGQLATFFAIPPGFASPIWPAAGFAVLVVLVYGPFALLGIFCASTLVNLTIAQGGPFPFGPVWLTAMGIALGSTFQTYIAVVLAQRFCNYPNSHKRTADTLRLGLLTGPIACTISCSVGTACLFFSNVLPLNAIPSNWLHWWIGDSIGAMVFAPIILMLNIRQGRNTKQKMLGFFALYLFLVSCASSVFLFAKEKEFASHQQSFLEHAKDQIEKINDQLKSASHVSEGMKAVFETFETIDQPHFSEYAKRLYHHVPGTQALSWIPIITQKNRELFEQTLLPVGAIRERIFRFTGPDEKSDSPTKNRYYPVYFIYPMTGNQAAIGFDLSSNPSRNHALEVALKTGENTITEPINLVQDAVNKRAFLLFTAVSSNSGEYIGVISVVFRVEDLIQSVISDNTLKHYAMRIDDISDAKAQSVFLSSAIENPFYHYETTIEFGQRRWLIQITPSASLLKTYQSWWVWFILVAAFLFVTLLGLFVLLLLSKNTSIEFEVELKTLALKKALEQAKRSSSVKSSFLASMSHELRTPLNSIVGFSQRLQKGLQGKIEPRYLDAIETVCRNGQHLLALINDILDLSKVEAGKMTINKIYFDLDQAVQDVLTALTPAAEAKNLEMVSQVPPVTTIYADRQRFIQILANLVSNAVKFSDQGRIKIDYQLKSVRERPGLQISVADSGNGIAAEDLPKLFRRYEQLGDTFQGGQIGTGLGLALVQELVLMHGGQVTVTSELGKGSIFNVWLPIQNPPTSSTDSGQ